MDTHLQILFSILNFFRGIFDKIYPYREIENQKNEYFISLLRRSRVKNAVYVIIISYKIVDDIL